MLGYTGTWEGKPISVQATGMGCPSAAIVMEELVQLGVAPAHREELAVDLLELRVAQGKALA